MCRQAEKAPGIGRRRALRRSGSSIRSARQVDSPCYHCLFPEHAEQEDERCATLGVFAPLVGIIGSVQAAETLKLLTGAGLSLSGRLLLLDGLNMEWRSIRLKKDPACPVCGELKN